ncbi:sporulation membrane protein YtaF [Peribacillus simplex]|jgi:putative sporulation protein YtaF|uniref:sporulation membrane protein YtaF n=1 Tax=Peribacillus simplex TaxID=1478 RepID=UPI003D2BBC16
MAWLLILGFALSSSLDNFGVGISYGIRKIRIKIFSNLFIAIICFLFSITGIVFGRWLSTILPGMFPIIVAFVLLTLIGLRIILLAVPRKNQMAKEVDKKPKSIKGILKNPESVDMDQSGYIGWGESIILGIALSANALTNGLGAGLLGLSPLAISLTAAFGSFITVWTGVIVGQKVANVRIGKFTLGQFGTMLSGIIILVLASIQLLG